MPDPFLLAQLSDPHIGADWGRDSVERLAAAVDAVRVLEPQPAAVLVSGDLVGNVANGEYEQARALLEPLEAPLYVLAGNHDDRAALRAHFEVPGTGSEPVQYAVDLGPVRLVIVDSTRPGEEVGELDADRLAWLDAALDGERGGPTIIAMHHPPLVTGVPAMDEIGLPARDRSALAEVVARHPHVERIVAGHVHRTVAASLADRPVLAVPSTYMQLRLDFRAPAFAHSSEPPGFAVHAVLDGEVTSHVQHVRPSS